MSNDLDAVRWLADMIAGWQAPGGGIDVEKCIFHSHTPLGKPSAYGQDVPWLARALYVAYDATGEPRYKEAADRYSVYFVATMYDGAPTFAVGDALDPCLSEYRRHNPHEDGLDEKATTLRNWILRRRTDLGHYFDVGYCWRDDQGISRTGSDAAFSNDLADVGRGLVFHGRFYRDQDSLAHAAALAQYFVRDYVKDSVDGVWSSSLGTWLIGPHPARGYENVDEYSNAAGWLWTNYYAAHFLHRLHDEVADGEVADGELKALIRDRCVSSLRWTFDECQFADGALGMSGRDDKWVGMTGLAILLYTELHAKGWLAGQVEASYLPKAQAAVRWLRQAARPDAFPHDGFVAVSGRTRPEPGWNSSWMIGITLEALVAARAIELSVANSGEA